MQKCDKCNGAGVTGLEAGAWGQQSVAIGPQKPDAIGPAVPTGSTAFIFEIAALNADNDRLRRELEEARAELARMRPVVEAARVCYSGECDMEHAHRQLKYAVRNYGAGKGGE